MSCHLNQVHAKPVYTILHYFRYYVSCTTLLSYFSKYSTNLLLPCNVCMYAEQFQARCAIWGYVALSEYMPSYFTQSCPWYNLTNTVPFHPRPTHLNSRWPVSLDSTPFYARSSAIQSYPVSLWAERSTVPTWEGKGNQPIHWFFFVVTWLAVLLMGMYAAQQQWRRCSR